MNTMGDRELVTAPGRSRCLVVKDHRRRQVTGSRGRQKVIHREGHTQGVQKGNSTGREKASNDVREIRQEVDSRKSDRLRYRQGIGIISEAGKTIIHRTIKLQANQHSKYKCVTKQTIPHSDGVQRTELNSV